MKQDNLRYYSNIILVAGNGRNVGKTTLCSNIIKQNKSSNIIAVKISPHFHDIKLQNEDVLFQDDDIILIEEHKTHGQNDSSKFKKAGAFRVFFIMVNDKNLLKAFTMLLEFTGVEPPMIIESAGLRTFMKPAQFFMLSHVKHSTPKDSVKPFLKYVDQYVTLFDTYLDFSPKDLIYQNDGWHLEKNDE